MEFKHTPVMLNECIEGLNINKAGLYVDGTLGGAGHSLEIIKLLENGKLIGIDRDIEAINAAKSKLKKFNNIEYVLDNHDNIKDILEKLNVGAVDGILLDLGVSSYQLDEKQRGFSYMQDGPLDMRMNKAESITAWDVVNKYLEDSLSRIIFLYGEDRFSKSIAKQICEYRKSKTIDSTKELAQIIEKAVPKFAQNNGHPAKKTFQAIRIEVNNELRPLYDTIIDSINCLNLKGRLCVITFHSLEDRIVKNAFIDSAGNCKCSKNLPYCVCGAKSLGEIITKKPLVAKEEEQKINSRSRSAKLRIFERKYILNH